MPIKDLVAALLQNIFGSSPSSIIANGLLVAILLGLLFLIVAEIFWYAQLVTEPVINVEMTPPVLTDKSPLATAQLFTVLHSLATSDSKLQRLLRHRQSISLEVVSTRAHGIRFRARLPKSHYLSYKQALLAYMPDLRFKKVKDFLPVAGQPTVTVFGLSKSYIHPLRTNDTLNDHDPISYLSGAMTKLAKNELMAFQLILYPTKPWSLRRRQRSIPNVKANQDYLYSVRNKLSQPLFKVSIRAMVLVKDEGEQSRRLTGLKASLANFNAVQTIKPKGGFVSVFGGPYRFWQFKRRLPAILPRSTSILSTSEMAAIFHFPHNQSARVENVIRSLSRTLPAPVSLKSDRQLDVVLGENHYQGSQTLIGLTAEERERHIYIVGGTGNGKTTMLLYGIIQDINNGKGLAVVDPHGDLAEAIIRQIPKSRLKDVIYFNPDDLDHPISMNLLELPEGLSGSNLLREKDHITEAVISLLRKIFSDDDSGGHRIEYILRNTIQTALSLNNPTIFTVFRLLSDDAYRFSVVRGLNEGSLKNFWLNEIGKAGSMQRVKMTSGVTAKIGRFEFSAATKRALGQSKSTINFDDILSSGKILIGNFSKGRLGEDTSALFGTATLAKLQLAAIRRERLKVSERRPFHLYVDEFQNFATMPFVQMLSEARKYKLFLSMAEQSTAQQEQQRLVDVILANVGTVVVFRSGSPADEQLLLPLFRPYIDEGEIANLPSYNFYIRIAAIEPQPPFSGSTRLLGQQGQDQVAQKVIETSRRQYSSTLVIR